MKYARSPLLVCSFFPLPAKSRCKYTTEKAGLVRSKLLIRYTTPLNVSRISILVSGARSRAQVYSLFAKHFEPAKSS